MHHFDLCFAWSWPYDLDFARLLESACQAEQISIFQVTPEKPPDRLRSFIRSRVKFLRFF